MGSHPRRSGQSGTQRSSHTSDRSSCPTPGRLDSQLSGPQSPGPQSPGPQSPGPRLLGPLLLGAVDGGLAAAIFVVPFALGGRIAMGQLAMVALAVWVALCWSIRQSLFARAAWIRSSTEPLLLAAVALICLQLVTLPPSWLNWLSPQHHETLALWNAASDPSGTLGAWSTISLTPTATRNALVLVLAFIMLFLTTVQRVRQVEDVERLIRWIAIATLSMAVFGIVQYLTSNGKFFWFYEHEQYVKSRSLQGSFTNRNHFAQFLALGIGPLVWWVWQAVRNRSAGNSKRPGGAGRSSHYAWEKATGGDLRVGMRVLALAISVFAILMSLSRGGVLSAGLAGLACLLILKRASLIDRKMLLGIAGAGLLVIACLSIYGYQALADRMDDFQSIAELDRGGRSRIWKANLAGIADYPITGTGLGSHREVYPIYLRAENHHRLEYTHAENGYLQIALETGLPGLLLALIGVSFCIYWCVQLLRTATSTRIFLCLAAITPALIASFAHSAVDFIWYVPGCMVTLVVLAACACRLWQLTRQATGKAVSEVWVSRAGWVAATFCLGPVGLLMLENRLAAVRAEPAWNRCVTLEDTLPQHGEPDPPQTLRSMAEELSTVVAFQPENARAHMRLAAVQIKLFNQPEDPAISPFDVCQVRETVLRQEFESSDAMRKWLSVAFGERIEHLDTALYHAREAIRLCPLQGDAYLYLADLSFLEGPNLPPKAALVQQALKVRPFDGNVLFVAGQEAVLAGDMSGAIELWQASFDLGTYHQNRLLSLLTPQVPAEFILDTFQPSVEVLQLVIKHFKDSGREDEARVVLAQYAKAAARQAGTEQGEIAAEYWNGAADAHVRLGNPAEARKCYNLALRANPTSFAAHRQLAVLLLKMKEFAEAEKHCNWYLQHDPKNKRFQDLLKQSVQGRLRARTTSAHRDQRPAVR